MKSNLSNNAESFIATEDVFETLEDGRVIQTAAKGVEMPIAEAKALGLTGDKAAAEPTAAEAYNEAIAKKRGVITESKLANAPAENKSVK